MFFFLAQVLRLYEIILFIRILMSWIQPRANWYKQPYKFLYDVTEPVMEPFRRLIPPIGGLDLSPILLFLLIGFLSQTLTMLSYRTGL